MTIWQLYQQMSWCCPQKVLLKYWIFWVQFVARIVFLLGEGKHLEGRHCFGSQFDDNQFSWYSARRDLNMWTNAALWSFCIFVLYFFRLRKSQEFDWAAIRILYLVLLILMFDTLWHFADGSEAVFYMGAMLEHSCSPNARFGIRSWDPQQPWIGEWQATKDIAIGEAVTMSPLVFWPVFILFRRLM